MKLLQNLPNLLLFTLLLLHSPFYTTAQTVRVLDETTLTPIAGVTIGQTSFQDPDASQTLNFVLTDAKGRADLSIFTKPCELGLKHFAYQTRLIQLYADQTGETKVYLTEKIQNLDAVVISASKFEEKRKDVAQQIEVLRTKDLALMSQPTLADVMQQSGQVLVQKSQQGGGSPMIRGFEASRVLMVIDGVRMNNAIYRSGHLQNVITMDNSILERVETVFGPGSVIYGSDALGGVMHFRSLNPILKAPTTSPENWRRALVVKGNAFARYSSANNENAFHIDFNLGGGRIGSLTSFTYTDFGDLRQGDNRNPLYGDWGKRLKYAERINGVDTEIDNKDYNIQKQSGYRQSDLLQKFLWKINENISNIVNIQYSSSSDIPRYDRLALVSNDALDYGQWYYGPQKRLLIADNLTLKREQGIYNQGNITVAFQDIAESRHDRRFGQRVLNHRTEKVKIFSANFDFNKVIGTESEQNKNQHEIRYGLELTHNDVNSTAFGEDIDTKERTAISTRYPDGGAQMSSFAGYLTHTWELQHWIFTQGLRYSYVGLQADFKSKAFFPFPYNEAKQGAGALNGNLGIIYNPTTDWRFALHGASGFRVPNVDDLGKVFDSQPGTQVLVPNPDLKPEYTYNLELSIWKTFAHKIRLEAVGYYTWYRDAIIASPFTFNGQGSIEYDEQLTPVFANQNEQRAYLCGTYFSLLADITENFAIASTLTYTYGRIEREDGKTPLDHIPPLFGKTSFRLNLRKFKSEFWVLYNGWKRLKDYNTTGTEDNLVQALPEYGMPAWMTLNVRTSYQINPYLQLQAALENMLDQNYRVFGSGISAAGRNLSVTLRGRF
jgi:hemoglobin/transferrin/lactoferrin receptor protein